MVQLYEIVEEEDKAPEMKFADEAPDMATEALKGLEQWANLYPCVLKNGRTTHKKPEGMDDETWGEKLAVLNEEDK